VVANAVDIPNYATNPREARRVTWYPQGWPWVDPLHEVQAAKMAVRCGFKSREAIIADMGLDPEIVEAQIIAENKRADAAGLIFDTDPRQTASAGAGGAGGSLEPGAVQEEGGTPAPSAGGTPAPSPGGQPKKPKAPPAAGAA
jgi:capsid protein